jgi:plasmid stability protein
VKTTLDLPDELMRSVKIRAVQENRKLKDMLAELLRRGLASAEQDSAGVVRNRASFPLIRCAHPATPEDEMTPDRVAEILLADEARDTSVP